MRIAVFITSASPDTAEYEGYWLKCPYCKETEDSRSLYIEQSAWKIAVFNGRDELYCNQQMCTWRYTNIAAAIKEIIEINHNSEYAILFHTNWATDIEDLKTHLTNLLNNGNQNRIKYTEYHSTSEIWDKFIIKLKNPEDLDSLFEYLWSEIHSERNKEDILIHGIDMMKGFIHKCQSNASSITMRCNLAKKKPGALGNIKAWWLEKLLEEFQKEIAPIWRQIGMNHTERVTNLFLESIKIIQILPGKTTDDAINLASKCIQKLLSVIDILVQQVRKFECKIE